jgi:hypothetical protein
MFRAYQSQFWDKSPYCLSDVARQRGLIFTILLGIDTCVELEMKGEIGQKFWRSATGRTAFGHAEFPSHQIGGV